MLSVCWLLSAPLSSLGPSLSCCPALRSWCRQPEAALLCQDPEMVGAKQRQFCSIP